MWDCCEGDVLLLLDSSGSIKSFEFSRLLDFLSELLQPFRLGRGHVRVALVLVGTESIPEFGLDTYDTQIGLQGALQRTKQLGGDTNTEQALRLVQSLLAQPEAPPTVLLWLTDGVEPGEVDGPMAELRRVGVSVLAVSIGHGNYQMLKRVVTPPIETHLRFVDIEDIGTITEDLREAIIELLRAECLQVCVLGSSSVVLQWRPVFSSDLGTFGLHYKPDPSDGTHTTLTLPGDSSWAELTGLWPDTPYTAWLVPDHSIPSRRNLSVSFRTLPERFGPARVTVSDLSPGGLRVSWSPVESPNQSPVQSPVQSPIQSPVQSSVQSPGQPEQVQSPVQCPVQTLVQSTVQPEQVQYRVEYGEIPSGPVRTVTPPPHQSSALLTQLRPLTEYLITVTALHSSGQQRALSVRACTPEVLPPLADLRLSPLGPGLVQVDWQGQGAGLLGYWVSWKNEDQPSSSSVYLPSHTLSTWLTHLSRGSRVCVSPVYRSARGEGLCCTAHT
ncbi:unnamed protein product [Leuciscus chuanchicus]